MAWPRESVPVTNALGAVAEEAGLELSGSGRGGLVFGWRGSCLGRSNCGHWPFLAQLPWASPWWEVPSGKLQATWARASGRGCLRPAAHLWHHLGACWLPLPSAPASGLTAPSAWWAPGPALCQLKAAAPDPGSVIASHRLRNALGGLVGPRWRRGSAGRGLTVPGQAGRWQAPPSDRESFSLFVC